MWGSWVDILYVMYMKNGNFHRVQRVGLAENSEQLLNDPVNDEDEGGIDIEWAADNVYDSYSHHQPSGTNHRRHLVSDGRDASEVEMEGQRGEGEGEETEEGWLAERVNTPLGLTDDIVNLANGKSYYFFKLPHKVITNT